MIMQVLVQRGGNRMLHGCLHSVARQTSAGVLSKARGAGPFSRVLREVSRPGARAGLPQRPLAKCGMFPMGAIRMRAVPLDSGVRSPCPEKHQRNDACSPHTGQGASSLPSRRARRTECCIGNAFAVASKLTMDSARELKHSKHSKFLTLQTEAR